MGLLLRREIIDGEDFWKGNFDSTRRYVSFVHVKERKQAIMTSNGR